MECGGGECGWSVLVECVDGVYGWRELVECVCFVGGGCVWSVWVEEGDMTVCFRRDAHTLLEMCSHAGIAASSCFIR